MATRFEVVLFGSRPEALRAAGEEALDEVESVEAWMSPYRTDSSLALLHREAHRYPGEPIPVDPRLFAFLSAAIDLAQETEGAFDPTVGPLLRRCGLGVSASVMPVESPGFAPIGWQHVALDPVRRTVRFLRPGIEFHPGAVGKGWALDRAAEVLREAGVASALLHGGTSSVVALGHPPDAENWRVALPQPPVGWRCHWPDGAAPEVALMDETLSVSAAWGRSMRTGDDAVPHIFDPRTDRPAKAMAVAAVALPSATASDAWSTALFVDGHAGRQRLESLKPGVRCWLLESGVNPDARSSIGGAALPPSVT